MKAAYLANVFIKRTGLVLGFLSCQVYLIQHLQGNQLLWGGRL